ncbi:MAG: hypothetical protein ACYC5A_03200 [Thermoleophilia bacterium]
MAAPGNAVAPSGRRTLVLAAAVFVAVFTAYIASWQTQRTDSVFVMHTAVSLVTDGDLEISEFASVRDFYPIDFVTEVDGNTYMEYPDSLALLAAPFALGVNTVTGGRLAAELDESVFSGLINATDMMIASFYTALAAVFVFLVCRRFLNDGFALAGTFIFAFCTATWSTTSRGLWMHGPAMMFLAVALYLAVLSRERPRLAPYLGIPLVVACVIRPTSVIPAGFFTAYVFIEHRHVFWRYLAWATLTLLPFLVLNFVIYGFQMELYHYADGLLAVSATIFEALAGNLISPARGLLVYSPVLILAAYGVFLKLKDRQMVTLDWALIGTVLAHWLLISTKIQWWGGNSFGPRLFSDILPIMVYFLIPVLARIQQAGMGKKKALVTVVGCLTLVSFLVNLHGATSSEPFLWSIDPIHIDVQPSRAWDWGDPPFLRGL